MTAEGYKTFINGSVMASFMEGIVASILEEKSGAGYGTNCSQLNTVISVIEAMYLCEGMWLFPFCAEDRFFNQPSCIYARAKPRRAKYTEYKPQVCAMGVFRSQTPRACFCLTKSDYFSDSHLDLWAYPPFSSTHIRAVFPMTDRR